MEELSHDRRHQGVARLMLTFEPAEHIYRWNGAVVPSVTQILSPLSDFSMIAPDVLEHKREIGNAVHKAIELSIAGELDEGTVAEEWRGYFHAWLNFVGDAGIHEADFGECETPLAHKEYMFAGTPDMAVFLNRRWSVIDVKTPVTQHPAWALQTAAYKELLNNDTKLERDTAPILDRFALQLREDGTYTLRQHKGKTDWTVFLSMLNVHKWRLANNV